jgi:hypothetical protein
MSIPPDFVRKEGITLMLPMPLHAGCTLSSATTLRCWMSSSRNIQLPDQSDFAGSANAIVLNGYRAYVAGGGLPLDPYEEE